MTEEQFLKYAKSRPMARMEYYRAVIRFVAREFCLTPSPQRREGEQGD